MKTKIIISISVLGAIIYLLMIFACATQAPLAYQLEKVQALEIINRSIGTSANGGKIYHSYEENEYNSFYCIHKVTWNGKHDADPALLVPTQTKLLFSTIDGNLVTGTMIVKKNTIQQNEVIGRFNKDKLMLYLDKAKVILTYTISNVGRQLVTIEQQRFVDNALTTSAVIKNGDKLYGGDYTYNTTYLLSTTDDYLGAQQMSQSGLQGKNTTNNQSQKPNTLGVSIIKISSSDWTNAQFKVAELTSNSKAEKAGLKQNDIIIRLNGESVDNISTDTFDERVYTENKDVVLTVIRPSQNNAVLKIELKNTVNQAVNQDSNAVDKMKKLKELFESGLITKEEYDKKKKEIIDGL